MINHKNLHFAMSAKFEDFAKLPNAQVFGEDDSNHYIYIDNGCDILGVAHIDSVQKFNGILITDEFIRCNTVDDRIGVYMLLYGLPSIGVSCDILLTDNEESGMSTAQFFETPKQYNWMFQFDRGYDDVVTYQFDDRKMEDELASAGFKVNYGIFSDICYLDHLGCCGFNVGCGMRKYHSKHAYVDIDALLSMTVMFRRFWSINQDCFFEYEPMQEDGDSRGGLWHWDGDDMYLWHGLQVDAKDNPEVEIQCDYCGVLTPIDELKDLYGGDALVCQGCCNHIMNTYIDKETADDGDDDAEDTESYCEPVTIMKLMGSK